MVWFDRSGKEIAKIGSSETATPAYPSISPDYRRVAVQRSVGGNNDIWLIELSRVLGIRFTSDPVPDIAPIWSPDGQRIVFSSLGKGGVFDLYQKLVTGAASQELLTSAQAKQATDWSRNGASSFIGAATRRWTGTYGLCHSRETGNHSRSSARSLKNATGNSLPTENGSHISRTVPDGSRSMSSRFLVRERAPSSPPMGAFRYDGGVT